MFSLIENTLSSRLNSAAGLPHIVWPSAPAVYEPVIGTPFIVPTVLNGASFNMTHNYAEDVTGVYNILLSYPSGSGSAAINAMADSIAAHFAVVRNLNDVRIVSIRKSSNDITPPWISCSVVVSFRYLGKHG